MSTDRHVNNNPDIISGNILWRIGHLNFYFTEFCVAYAFIKTSAYL